MRVRVRVRTTSLREISSHVRASFSFSLFTVLMVYIGGTRAEGDINAALKVDS